MPKIKKKSIDTYSFDEITSYEPGFNKQNRVITYAGAGLLTMMFPEKSYCVVKLDNPIIDKGGKIYYSIFKLTEITPES